MRSWPLELVSERDFETSWSFLIAPSLNDNNKNRSTVSNELCFEVLIRSKREVIEEDDVVCISILAPPLPLPVPGFVACRVALDSRVFLTSIMSSMSN